MNFGSYTNLNSIITAISDKIKGRDKTFSGTHTAWNALTTEQKAQYDFVAFNDDYDEILDDTTTANNKVWSSQKVNSELCARDLMGAKNLLRYPYYDGTKTANEITAEPQVDGRLILSGTATANFDYAYANRNKPIYLPNGRYILRCEPNSTLGTGCRLFIDTTYNSNWKVLFNDIDFNTDFVFEISDETQTDLVNDYGEKGIGVHLIIGSGTVADDLIVTTMIRVDSISDNTYQSYAKTNRELTNMLSFRKNETVRNGGVAFAFERFGNIVSVNISGEATQEFSNSTTIINIPDEYKYKGNVTLNVVYVNLLDSSSKLMVLYEGKVTANSKINIGDKPRGTFTYFTY